MKIKYLSLLIILILAACKGSKETKNTTTTMETMTQKVISGYAPVNGLKMYYEIRGEGGTPLVLIHGGGSTIQTTFGRVIDSLSTKRKVIGVELQSHGHTEDIDRPLSFEQDADDVAGLLAYLKIDKADFFGFSNGGSTTLQIAIRHPQLLRKAIVASAMYKRNGLPDQFWGFMKNASLENMPQPLQKAYKEVAPNPNDLIKMHDKDVQRMVNFKDWKDEDLKAIQSPVLVISSDKDVILPEHTVAMYRLLPKGNLAIFPGVHGEFLGEITTLESGSTNYKNIVPWLEEFLDKDTSTTTGN